MSWQTAACALFKRFGPGAKLAAGTLLRAALAETPAVAELAEHALECVHQTPKRLLWRIHSRSNLWASPSDLDRLGTLLETLAATLPDQLEKWVALDGCPFAMREAVCPALKTDRELRRVAGALRKQADQFDRRGRAFVALADLPLATPVEQFTHFPLHKGVCYGCWSLWLTEPGVGLVILNAPTGTFVRVWLGCNGWFEYRTALVSPGRIFTVWSGGDRSVEFSRHLESLDRCGLPRRALPDGRFLAEEWTVEATASRLILEHTMTGRVLSFERDRPEWDCNDMRWNELGPRLKEIIW